MVDLVNAKILQMVMNALVLMAFLGKIVKSPRVRISMLLKSVKMTESAKTCLKECFLDSREIIKTNSTKKILI